MCTRAVLAFCAALLMFGGQARSEVGEVRIGVQFGLTYLPFAVAEQERLVERYAERAGLGDLKVAWPRFSGPNDMNTALLSGNLDVAPTAMPGFLILWARGRGRVNVKALAGYGTVPFTLVTNNPAVRSLRDFTSKDRIAVTGVQTSLLAILLQMAAAKEFGPDRYSALDPLMVSRAHPDAMAQVISGRTEINSHFSIPPYAAAELAAPGVRAILTSRDISQTAFANGVVYLTEAFHDANPKVVGAILAALTEACRIIRDEPRRAAEIYLLGSGEKTSPDAIMQTLQAPGVVYDTVPHGILDLAKFMFRTGTLVSEPRGYDDILFPEAPRSP